MKKHVGTFLLIVLIASILLPFSETKFWADAQLAGSSGNTINNITVDSVTCSQSFVQQGFPATVTADIENSGSSTVSIDVTFSINGITISTQTITLQSEGSTVASTVWNTAGFALGNYVLSVTVCPVGQETSAAGETCIGNTILLTCSGDLTGQGEVDSVSFFAFTDAYINYNCVDSSHQCNPAADFDQDGAITSADFFEFMSAYIAYWIGPTPFVHDGGLTLTLSTAQTDYPRGEPVDFTVSVNNVSDKTISFTYTGGFFDYIVYNSTGIIYRDSLGKAVPMFAMEVSLLPGTSKTQSFEWDQVCNFNSLSASPCALVPTLSCPVFRASPGTYYIVGEALGMQTLPQQITISATP